MGANKTKAIISYISAAFCAIMMLVSMITGNKLGFIVFMLAATVILISGHYYKKLDKEEQYKKLDEIKNG